jgi:DNA invertase Pin-like site-specific DNA recombinase
MSGAAKITSTHLSRCAHIYVRQSTPSQLERNIESTDRQYALAARAIELGWSRDAVVLIDDDLGVSGSGTADRPGFARMTAEVALGRVGIVLGLEVSRLARNNADWYRLIDLCALTDTLIGDADGVYHPAAFNDRLVLGLKGTMSEAELHVLRARLEGGIRNKAARGELKRGLPVGLVWGEDDGEVLMHPDEAVTGAIATVFARFAELGSVRKVWLWFRQEGLSFPLQKHQQAEIAWVTPSYVQIHHVLTNPAYAGAYAYGKTRRERYVDAGQVRTRLRRLPREEWGVLITDHHKGFIDWPAYEANQARIASNTRPRPRQPGGAVREGCALLQGIACCGRCGRKLAVHYQGRNSTPGYHCPGRELVDGRGQYCMSIGGVQIDRAVAEAFLAALTPAGLDAALAAAEALESNYDASLEQWRLEVERGRYEAERAERRYRAAEPENRLVTRGLETEWEQRLRDLAKAEAELAARDQRRPRAFSQDERDAIRALGSDLTRVWSADTTTDGDRKELLRTLVEEVIVAVDRVARRADVTLRWKGGAITQLEVTLPRPQPKIRTDEDTVALIRRLAVHYPDAVIAGILNRQGRLSATGQRFTAVIVQGLRHSWGIARHEPPSQTTEGELVTVAEAARILRVAPSTLHRWLNDGFIVGEQTTPGAPWRIRMTDELRASFVEEAPPGWLPMLEATMALGVSRQTVLQRVKRGELRAVHVRRGRRKGLRIQVIRRSDTLFDESSRSEGAL